MQASVRFKKPMYVRYNAGWLIGRNFAGLSNSTTEPDRTPILTVHGRDCPSTSGYRTSVAPYKPRSEAAHLLKTFVSCTGLVDRSPSSCRRPFGYHQQEDNPPFTTAPVPSHRSSAALLVTQHKIALKHHLPLKAKLCCHRVFR